MRRIALAAVVLGFACPRRPFATAQGFTPDQADEAGGGKEARPTGTPRRRFPRVRSSPTASRRTPRQCDALALPAKRCCAACSGSFIKPVRPAPTSSPCGFRCGDGMTLRRHVRSV